MFVDEARIQVAGGKGGDGCMSMRREKYRPKGGPAGGNGGRGGSVMLVASTNRKTLLPFRGGSRFQAEPGKPGGKNDRTGRSGGDLVVEVPVGTVVRDADSSAILRDLTPEGARLLVARGGRGGRGNRALMTEQDPLPRWAEKGMPPEERWVRLELKVMADVGLLGLPNAGKSTLLAAVSNARPKIAAYPFTTLEPQLGVVSRPDSTGESGFVMADIPGLVQGASAGTGIGDRFLRHLDRTRVLVHLVDVSGWDGGDPVKAYRTIRRELELYHPRLATKPEVVVASKMDLPDASAGLEDLRRRLKVPVLALSAATRQGVDELIATVLERLAEFPEGPVTFDPTPVIRIETEDPFEIQRIEKDFWIVHGGEVDRLVETHDLADTESLDHLDRVLRAMGVFARLKKRGCEEGHTVRLGDFLFDYIPE